ncbi:putative membrane protein [Microbacterium endophyticum]|uniref:Putative membrane protein n=1 Tax=Microbacterium endophyticum TaxID=1526412 RepID=A0A7W4V1E5_9MICO|nr:hypothetical protein [Microbacterium endophyticum]MBB2975042.1 putative membrane protein [Microbacterium endophyticum]NIK37418.1 putative membrane protein [Microbacterium endophyticum]
MSAPDLAPRRPLGGIVTVWIAAAIAGLVVGFFVPSDLRSAWTLVALGGAIILSFIVQLWYGQTQRFIQRTSLSILGALIVLGIISAGFRVAALIPA